MIICNSSNRKRIHRVYNICKCLILVDNAKQFSRVIALIYTPSRNVRVFWLLCIKVWGQVWKSQLVNILGFIGHMDLWQILSSVIVAWKKLQAIHKRISMAAFQKNFIYKNRLQNTDPYSVSLPTLGIFCSFHFSHSSQCVVIFHCGFKSHILDGWSWASFQVLPI